MKKILKHDRLIIIIIALITLFFAFQLPKIEIDNDIMTFLPDDNQSVIVNNKMEDIFGSSDSMIVAVKVKKDNIFTSENINLINQMTEELAGVENVDEVTSFSNSDYIEGTSEGMVVEELVKEIPETESEITDFKSKLLSWDFYKNNLYSNDFKATQLLISLKDDVSAEQEAELYYDIKKITDKFEQGNLETHIAGTTAINVLLGDKMIEDVKYLIPFIIVILFLALFLFFRKILPVILIMLTVSISTIWSVGLMAMLGIKMTLVSTVIPVLLLAVGSAYGIHILSHYYDYLADEKGNLSLKRKQQLVLKTVESMGKPVFLAGLTTVAGFGSLATSKIVPIKNFGLFTALGIFVAFMIAILMIPALLLIINRKSDDSTNENYSEVEHFENLIVKLHNFYSQKSISLLLVIFLVVIISLIGMDKIIIDSPLINMFKENTEIRQADNFINNNFAGSSILTVLVEGNEKGSLTDPEILKSMEEMQNYLVDNNQEVGKASSISTFIKRMNRVMHYPETASENNQEAAESENQSSQESGGASSSFYSEADNSDSTSSFYSSSDSSSESSSENSSSSFYSQDQDSQSTATKAEAVIENRGPETEKKLSEYELVALLNNALAEANSLDLSSEEFVELINKKLNYKGARYNEIPYDLSKYPAQDRQGLKNLVSQYLLLYSGSLDDMINDQLEPDKARMLVQLNEPSNIVTARIKQDILDYGSKNFPEEYDLSIAGHANMSLAANELIIGSQINSIIVSFIIVFIIVALAYRSIIAGIYGVIPLAFSLLINFALMGYTGIKLDIGTAMVASVAIGIGVDYTIHFLDKYHENRMKTDDLHQVTRNTLISTGKAIIFNALSVAAGFLVLLFSNFYPLVYLGLLIAVTMFTSSIASMTILPLMLKIFKPKFIAKEL
jgi:predicted RND superfamily exporter protein